MCTAIQTIAISSYNINQAVAVSIPHLPYDMADLTDRGCRIRAELDRSVHCNPALVVCVKLVLILTRLQQFPYLTCPNGADLAEAAQLGQN